MMINVLFSLKFNTEKVNSPMDGRLVYDFMMPQSRYAINSTLCTHCSQVMHIDISKLTSIGSDNGLSPGRHQAII